MNNKSWLDSLPETAKQAKQLSDLGWYLTQTGLYWVKRDPDDEGLYWLVEQRDGGWYWFSRRWININPGPKTSSDFGPFTSWMAAASDCEVAHHPVSHL